MLFRAGLSVLLRVFKVLLSGKFSILLRWDELLGEENLKFRLEAFRLGQFLGIFTGYFEYCIMLGAINISSCLIMLRTGLTRRLCGFAI